MGDYCTRRPVALHTATEEPIKQASSESWMCRTFEKSAIVVEKSMTKLRFYKVGLV